MSVQGALAQKAAAKAQPPKLRGVIRLDSLPLGQTYFTPEGYLKDRPILTRVGIFEYENADGSVRRELRLPEDVFDPESLASYRGKPIIITHDAGLIDKSNVHEESIGTILSEGYRSEDCVRAEIIIHDTEAMKESKLKELSLGYSLDLEETPGEWNGQHYDAIQRNIRINHLALVGEARAGDKARLNIDGRGKKKSLEGGKVMGKTTQKNHARTDGILSEEELKQAIEEYKAKRAAAEGEVPKGGEAPAASAPPAAKPEPEKKDNDEPAGEQTAGEQSGDKPVEEQVAEIKEAHKDADPDMQKLFDIIDTLLAKMAFDDAAEGEKKPAEAAPATEPTTEQDGDDDVIPNQEAADCGGTNLDDDDDKIPSSDEGDVKPGEVLNADSVDAIIRNRIQVGMMGKALNMDGLETMNLMDAKKAVIKAVRPTLNLDGKSKTYINAAYEMACDEVRSRTAKDTNYQKRQMFNGDSKKAAATDSDSSLNARERMIARQQNKKEEK